jgi:hypothetical protein
VREKGISLVAERIELFFSAFESWGGCRLFRFSVKWREERPPLVSIPRGAWIFKA